MSVKLNEETQANLEKIIKIKVSEPPEHENKPDDVVLLGHDENGIYYYFSNVNHVMKALGPSAHERHNFLAMANTGYWLEKYPGTINEKKNAPDVVNWVRLEEILFQAQAAVGFFDPSRVRGKGCWDDKGKLIVNMGNNLYYEKKTLPISNLMNKTNYYYEASAGFNMAEPATNEECKQIISTFKKLLYKNQHDYICLVGFIMFSQIAGALKWRPHIWITGPAGCGKTHILKYIANLIYLKLETNNASAAGIRQKIKNNFNTVIYDESEPDQGQTSLRMNQVLNLMREVSTREGGSLRGSQTGRAIQFNTNANFCFGSIQASNLSVADSSRIYLIEMLPTLGIQTRDEFMQIDTEMQKMVSLAPKLFSRMVMNFDMFLENLEVCKMIIAKENISHGSNRQYDQFAPFIAGYWAAISTEGISPTFIKECIDALRLKDSENFRAMEINQADELISCIFEKNIDNFKKLTIGRCIESINNVFNDPNKKDTTDIVDCRHALEVYGIRIKNNGNLFISHTNTELKKLLKTDGYTDIGALLRRNKYLIKEKDDQKISGKTQRGVELNLAKIMKSEAVDR